jgi:uncharacterized membrane protein
MNLQVFKIKIPNQYLRQPATVIFTVCCCPIYIRSVDFNANQSKSYTPKKQAIMIKNKTYRMGLIITAIIAITAMTAPACSVPVFRYALERWVPDDYQLVIIQHHKPSQLLSDAIEKLRLADMNIRIQTEKPTAQAIAGSEGELRLYLPPSSKISKPIWSGQLTTNTIEYIMNSPVRKKISSMIMEGESVVWLLLEGNSPEQNRNYKKLLTKELHRNQSTLKLPIISESDAYIAEAPGRAQLKISFSMITLSRNDANETVLINALLNSNPDNLKTDQTMVFPICGAGRAYPPLIGAAIDAENINNICTFLTGECSCEIKGQNPGFDLPINANWGASADGQLYTEVVLPPLTGVISEKQHTNSSSIMTNQITKNEESPAEQETESQPPRSSATPLTSAIITMTTIITAVIITSIIMRRKSTHT